MEWVSVWWSRRTWAQSLLVQSSLHFTFVIVGPRCIDAYWTAWVWFWNGHRTRAIHLVLIVFRATPKHAFFTLTISHITIVIQHQNRIPAWWCLIRYIHMTNCSPNMQKKDETNEIKRGFRNRYEMMITKLNMKQDDDWSIFLFYNNFYLGCITLKVLS